MDDYINSHPTLKNLLKGEYEENIFGGSSQSQKRTSPTKLRRKKQELQDVNSLILPPITVK